jgi:hypothetical protein
MGDFLASVSANLGAEKFANFYKSTNPVEAEIMKLYGAVFLSRALDVDKKDPKIKPVFLPDKCRFDNEAASLKFRARLDTTLPTKDDKNASDPDRLCDANGDPLCTNFDGEDGQTGKSTQYGIRLQQPAMRALMRVVAKLKDKKKRITPVGENPAERSIERVRQNWHNGVKEAVQTKSLRGKLSTEDKAFFDDKTNAMDYSTDKVVNKVLALEAKGTYFHKSGTKSLAKGVALPKSSQHNLLLALDIKEFDDTNVVTVMGEFGWFRTIHLDHRHFTFLGLQFKQLQENGLINKDGYWVPIL